ncbi:MAG: rhodanese-like domain-containing protein [Bacteroidetes bacterium]|nr:rhodanese-like domain-containing protein [Bacteroidota bacterium]
MTKLKSLGFVILLIAITLILVIARNSNKNLFKKDAQYAIDVATKSINSISAVELKKLSPQYLIVDLNTANNYNSSQFQNSINIPFKNVLDKTNRKVLGKAKGEIVLFSNDVSTASKAWVILNQLGFENVFILRSEENPEVFKYKFQPDTSAKLE